jgi:uncharacterized membrane protein
MNPFDLKSALLAKHAQHVVLIHFPIALFLTGTAFHSAARFARQAGTKAALMTAARLNLLAAAGFVLPTFATGILAWQWLLEGKRLKGLLLLHLVLASVSTLLITLVGWIHLRQRHAGDTGSPAFYLLPLEGLTVAVVSLTAHVGGFLSGVNVPG